MSLGVFGGTFEPDLVKQVQKPVKSFLNDSAIFDFHVALGQFLNYHLVLEENEQERVLFLAVPVYAYDSFFQRDLPKAIIRRYGLKLIVYDPVDEVITKWIS